MKLLCITCDQSMKLASSDGPTEGSVSLTFRCPTCGHQILLLTNPGETRLVGALGVRIGGREEAPPPLELATSLLPHHAIPEPAEEPSRAEIQSDIEWTGEALTMVERVPAAIRPMVQKAVERYARLHGHREISSHVVEQAKDAWNTPAGPEGYEEHQRGSGQTQQ